jgi:hypothetical protein
MKNYLFCIWSLFGLTGILLTSCSGSPKHPMELAAADSLNRVIKSIDSVVRKIDSVAIQKAFEKIDYSLRYIQFNQKDTIRKEDGLMLQRFFTAKRPLSVYIKLGGELNRKIKEEKERCKNLAHDLRHNTLNANLDAKTCVASEQAHVASLALSANTLGPAITEAMKSFEDLQPKVEIMVKALQAKGGKEPPAPVKSTKEEEED